MASADELAGAKDVADEISRLVRERGLSVATAESLTGGKISCQLGVAESSAEWFAGSVVAYMSRVKYDVLKVPEGPVVTEECAAAMAEGVAGLLGADLAVAVTGVGGPDEEEGHPAGTVWFGVRAESGTTTELRRFEGDPSEIVDKTTLHALHLLLDHLKRT
jgi:nicotinamide-nucleotide amidase